MEPENSLRRSQEPATGPCLEPDQSGQRRLSCLLKIHLNVVLPARICLTL